MSSNLKLWVFMQNSYFNTSDFKNPIKKYLKPYYVTSSFNYSHYYVMSVAFNEAYLNGNYIIISKVYFHF